MCSKAMNDCYVDLINWTDEATAVINDVKDHVREMSISSALQATELEIYLNCETLESKRCTIRLSGEGFQIVGNGYDKADDLKTFPYETPYALLNALSPRYSVSFSSELSKALEHLQNQNRE